MESNSKCRQWFRALIVFYDKMNGCMCERRLVDVICLVLMTLDITSHCIGGWSNRWTGCQVGWKLVGPPCSKNSDQWLIVWLTAHHKKNSQDWYCPASSSVIWLMTQCTISKFKDGTKLRGRIDMLRCVRASTQKECNKLADWIDIMRFSTKFCI